MSYDLRDIEGVPIIAVAKKLGMTLGYRGEIIHAECPFRYNDDAVHEPLSLAFDRQLNAFQCLSCEFRGSVLELVCYVAQLGPSDAIEWIGTNFHLPGLPSAKSETASASEGAVKAGSGMAPGARMLKQVYDEFLRLLGGLSPHAIEYMEGRGISAETLKKHGVMDLKGYHGTSSFLRERFPTEVLRQAGIVDATGKLWFEEYPLVFPYFRDGEVAFLQAHCMDLGKNPCYLRPREAVPLLYNVDVLRTLGDGDRVFLVEGIMDCLTLEERGYHAVAAPDLSHFKPEWVRDFMGLEMCLVHSGDEVAERAARAIAVVFGKFDVAVQSLRLPGGHDVNSFFAQGGTQLDFEHLVWTAPKIKTSRPLIEGQTRSAMAEFLEEVRDYQRRTRSVGRSFLGLDTGFGTLTEACGGLDPLGSGQMCVVTGPPAITKTTFCLQLAWQILEKNELAVLYISYNEAKFLLRLKTLCQISRLSANSILRGEVQADRLASAVEEMSRWGKAFFAVEGNKSTTIEVIRDYCQRVRSLTGESRVLLVVDHLEAIPHPDETLHGNARIEACASELHFLSRDLAIPIMLVSSTAVQQASSARHNLNGYSRIEYSEDLMLLLEPGSEAAKERGEENGVLPVRVAVTMNRYGGVGTVSFNFLPDCHCFEEKMKRMPSAEMAGVLDVPERETCSPAYASEIESEAS